MSYVHQDCYLAELFICGSSKLEGRKLETEQAGKQEEHLKRSYLGRGCSMKRVNLAEKREASGKCSLRIVSGESKMESREISEVLAR